MKISIDSYNFDSSSFETLNVKNYSFDVTDYWEEEGSKNEYIQYYAEKGEKIVMLSIAYPAESDDNYDVSFDGLYADNDNMINAVGAMFTNGDVIDYKVFESDYGVKGILYRFTYNQKINSSKKQMEVDIACVILQQKTEDGFMLFCYRQIMLKEILTRTII